MRTSGPVAESGSSRRNPGRAVIRDVAAIPRKIPWKIREELAVILVTELIDGKGARVKDSAKFIQRYGFFYAILIHLRHIPSWSVVRDLVRKTPDPSAELTRFITTILDLLERVQIPDTALCRDLDEAVQDLVSALQEPSPDFGPKESPGSSPWFYSALIPILEEIKTLLDRISRQVMQNPQAGESVRDEISDALHTLADLLSWHQEQNTSPDTPEIGDLIDRLRKALSDLAEDGTGPESENKGSPLPGTGSQIGGPGESTASDSTGGAGQGDGAAAGNGNISSLVSQANDLLVKLEEQMNRLSSWERPVQPDSPLEPPVRSSMAGSSPSLHRPEQQPPESITYLTRIFPGTDWGMDISSLTSVDTSNLDRIAQTIRNSPDLKRILRFIGRSRVDYGMKARSISPMGRSEIFSFTRSADISRLLPAETVLLRHPVLRRRFFAGFTEGSLLTYHLEGRHWAGGRPKKKRNGPVIALVDTSGSMNGYPELVAKSIILALCGMMVKQERPVKVILFSGPGNTHEIELTSRRKMQDEFVSFLESSFGGGTDFTTALRAGLASLRQTVLQGSDILFITDGDAEISDRRIIHEWKQIKKEQKARVFSCIIGGVDAGGLAPISDSTYLIQNDQKWNESDGSVPEIRFIPSPDNREGKWG